MQQPRVSTPPSSTAPSAAASPFGRSGSVLKGKLSLDQLATALLHRKDSNGVAASPSSSSSASPSTTTPTSHRSKRRTRLTLSSISQMKLAAVTRRHQHPVHALERTEEGDEAAEAEQDTVNTPAEQSVLPRPLNLSPSLHKESIKNPKFPPVVQPPTIKQSIVTFDTKEVKWKAHIREEIEKFMYPSLKLEAVYKVQDPAQEEGEEEDHVPIVPADVVDQMIGKNTPINWSIEKQFQNSAHVGPLNGHTRMTEEEAKRRAFDERLDMAEGLLRKKECAVMDFKKQQHHQQVQQTQQLLLLRHHQSMLFTRHEEQTTKTRERRQNPPIFSIGELNKIQERKRSSILPDPSVKEVNGLQRIMRLPRAQQIHKAIEKHATKDGQIEYYGDKTQLFTKWKKLHHARLHHQIKTDKHDIPSDDDEEDHNEEDEEDVNDMTMQLYGRLSPRSLFFHECIKHNVLPEPIYSRINYVHDAKNQRKKKKKRRQLALELQHFGLGDDKLNALSKSLRQFHAIQILNLCNNRLTDASLLPLLQALEHTATSTMKHDKKNPLRELNLSQNQIGTAGCLQIAQFLTIAPALTHLDLSQSQLGRGSQHDQTAASAAFAALTTAMQTHRALRVVNFSYNEIGEQGGALLGQMLMEPTCAIEALDLSWNQICRSGAIAIGKALRINNAISLLNLSMNRFGDAGGEYVAAALAMNQSLTDLDLSHNGLGGRTGVSLGFYLRTNTSLRQLQLQENELGPIGTKALLHMIAIGASDCDITLDVHDIDRHGRSDKVFDVMLPSLCSPFTLDFDHSPYDFVVASELFKAALKYQRCELTDMTFTDTKTPVGPRQPPKKISLLLDHASHAIIDASTKKEWTIPDFGMLTATAVFTPPPLITTSNLDLSKCDRLFPILQRPGLSSRDTGSLLDLALFDFYLTTTQADALIEQLQSCMSMVDLVGRVWPCLIDGDNAFTFLRRHLPQPDDQRRLIDLFTPAVIQFTTANPTGHWSLDLSDRKQRKIALWFTMINAHEAAFAQEHHPKRTDCSQFGKGLFWRNVRYNRKPTALTYAFFNQLPTTGVLEFDFVSLIRYEDLSMILTTDPISNITSMKPNTTTRSSSRPSSRPATKAPRLRPAPLAPGIQLNDQQLDEIIQIIGAEVCSVYIPLHKRKDLKYQHILFHIAIGNRYLTITQVHHLLQFFPKNYDDSRLRVLIAVHKMVVDIENFGHVLDRLAPHDRQKLCTSLGYLNVLNPLFIDIDYEVDFEREDEKLLLRALVDLSMTCPMDIIRIESERSDVVVIYSMYQTNSVPNWGKIFFRYVSHPPPSRHEWVKTRQLIGKHFLCGERLKTAIDTNTLSVLVSPQAPLPSGAPNITNVIEI